VVVARRYWEVLFRGWCAKKKGGKSRSMVGVDVDEEQEKAVKRDDESRIIVRGERLGRCEKSSACQQGRSDCHVEAGREPHGEVGLEGEGWSEV